jgi:glycosyltransferase involved in cell wall biosynthesis
MRVCLITNEVFGLGRYGGFGKLTKMLAEHLVEKGVEAFVISWRGPGQREIEHLNGVTILSFPYNPSNSISYLHSHFYSYLRSLALYRIVDADIYHSIEIQLSTYIAQKAMPNRKHIVWFQDPYDEKAYREMSLVDKGYAWNTNMKVRFYSTLAILRATCNESDGLFTQAQCFMPIVKRLYQPKKDVLFLPNPVEIPNLRPEKSSEPTVCFLGRWDPQKHVERFFELAQRFPEIKFIAMGKSHYKMIDAQLRRQYRKVQNLEMPGLVSDTEKERILSKSWVLVNTSIREGLPISFLEALAHRTAILSRVDPDKFANRFGYHVKEDSLNCFEEGLKKLLENDLWKEKGEKGYIYVKEKHEVNKVVCECIENYKRILYT